MDVEILKIVKEPITYLGKNNIGLNVYKYRWVVYVRDSRTDIHGLFMRIKNMEIPVRKEFIGTKPQVKKWLKENNLEFNFG